MGTDTLLGHTLAGRYTVDRFLREDVHGRVYAASLTTGKQVSIKVLHPHLIDDTETMARFGREMIASATVKHPGVVEMIDFGQHRDLFHFLVIELIEAPTLAEVLAGAGRLEPDRVVRIASQIASALASAHGEGIIHRNLSPANILIVDPGGADRVKIRDFGLAKLTDSDDDDSAGVTAVGARVGTTEYMAPEYILDARVDPRSDLYALGCLMMTLLTGEPPFTGSKGAVMEMHVDDDPPAPSSRVRKIPPEVDEIVLSLLAKTPEERPATAAAVQAALDAIAPPAPAGEPARASGGGGGLGLVAVAVLVLALVAVLGAVGLVVVAGLAGALTYLL